VGERGVGKESDGSGEGERRAPRIVATSPRSLEFASVPKRVMGLVSVKNRRRVDAVERRAETLEAAQKVGRVASYVIAGGIGLLGAIGAVGAAARYLCTSPDFALSEIRFTGLSHVAGEDLRRLGGIAEGENLFTADLTEVERRIRQHPWVRSVSVERQLPHRLQVHVCEWVPVAILDLGHLYLVSEDGEVFRRVGAGDDFDLPLITGIARDAYVDRRDEFGPVLKEAVAAIEAYGRTPLAQRETLSEVHLDAERGVSLRLGKNAYSVKLGSSPFEEKLARLIRLDAELKRAQAQAEVIHLEGRSRPGWVAVRFSNPGAFGSGR
jgi:cell division protein FtsQ